MSVTRAANTSSSGQLSKAATGISGLDQITYGGLPRGRTTLVCGGPGCGKTLMAMEFLVRGARDLGESGLYCSLEETTDELIENVRSLGFDVENLVAQKKLQLRYVALSHAEVVEAGEFSLDGLLIRLEHALKVAGATRLVLDGLGVLFSHLSSEHLRSEIGRLFTWLKSKGITAVVTAEQGDGALTRDGFEEYVSDCVILLDHRVEQNVSKRRLRVVKYRGSRHGADEYPFLIGSSGIEVFPITALKLDEGVSDERVSTGVADLDQLLEGGGYYRGSSILISGTAGTGKSTMAATFAESVCLRGERCLYLAFEEPKGQILRNMRSVGIELERFGDEGLLQMHAARPTLHGLEEHLVSIIGQVDRFQPRAVVLDPISNFESVGNPREVKSMLARVFDHLRSRGITTLVTSLIAGVGVAEDAETGVSSLMDSWIVLAHQFTGASRHRRLYVIKSRGMAHAEGAFELVISSSGLSLRGVEAAEGTT